MIRIRRRDGFQIGSRFVELAKFIQNRKPGAWTAPPLMDKDAAFAKIREIKDERA